MPKNNKPPLARNKNTFSPLLEEVFESLDYETYDPEIKDKMPLMNRLKVVINPRLLWTQEVQS